MSRFAKFPNLPQIPQHLWPNLDIPNANEERLWQAGPRTVIKNNHPVPQDQHARFAISPELKSWVDANIRNDYVNIGISYMWDGSAYLPHTDATRDIALIYVFETGGPDVRTVFYKFKNSDQLHQKNQCWPTDLDELEELESVIVGPQRWAVLDGLVIHSVEGRTGPRIGLQLGFSKDNEWARNILNHGEQ